MGATSWSELHKCALRQDIVLNGPNGDGNWANSTHSHIVVLAGGLSDVVISGNFHHGGDCREYCGVFATAGDGFVHFRRDEQKGDILWG
jgi:hypothetical protein